MHLIVRLKGGDKFYFIKARLSQVKFKKKILRYSLSFAITIGLLLHFYAPRFVTEVKNPFFQIYVKKKPVIQDYEYFKLNGKYFVFDSYDGLKIRGYLASTSKVPKGTVILLHGIRSRKEHFAKLMKRLTDEGFNAVAIDQRAHGKSEGIHCTFGVKEKRDVTLLLDYLEDKEGVKDNIGVWGQSFGGAVALQAMSEDHRIKYGVIESTFSDFNKITHDYFTFHAGFDIALLTDYLVWRAGQIADFEPSKAGPNNCCQDVFQPVLMVHGQKDKRINISYGKENFARLASKDKTFIEVEDANHLNIWKVGGEEYFRKVLHFLNGNAK